jgi:prophage antirepressor-like protein
MKLDEFVEQYKLSKFCEAIKNEFKLTKTGKITKNDIVKILSKYQSTDTIKVIDKYQSNDNEKSLKDKVIDFGNKIFKYAEQTFSYIIVNGVIYFKAKEIAEFLGYVDTKRAIQKHVSDKYKKTFEEIIKNRGVDSTPQNFKGDKTSPLKFNPVNLTGLMGNEKNTIYITESGLYQLIFASKKKEAEDFQEFLCEQVLPALRKTGTYSVHAELKDRHTITVKDIILDIILDTSSVKSLYSDTKTVKISQCKNANI